MHQHIAAPAQRKKRGGDTAGTADQKAIAESHAAAQLPEGKKSPRKAPPAIAVPDGSPAAAGADTAPAWATGQVHSRSSSSFHMASK